MSEKKQKLDACYWFVPHPPGEAIPLVTHKVFAELSDRIEGWIK
jgi:hypothetical protein